jgi:alpha-glucosidase (family GH31 glycosyl hydrolase)
MSIAGRKWLLVAGATVACFSATTGLAQTYLGNYSGYDVAGRSINVHAGSATVRFVFYTSEIVRVDFLPVIGTVFDSSVVVIRDATFPVATSVVESDSILMVQSSSLTITIRKTPLRISYHTSAGQSLLSEPASGGLGIQQTARFATFALSPFDHFYGAGERGIGLDLRGRSFDSYNTQSFGYGGALSTMNINVPLLASTNGYALYFENTYSGRFDLGVSDANRWWYRASGGELSYFLIVAPTVQQQIERYTWLTGRQPLPPRWAFGFLQSKYGYQSEAEARAIVQTMRQRQIPCDGIILDLYWYANMGDLSWNFSSWPAPFQMMSDFLADGIKTIVITEPYITSLSLNFGEASNGGYVAANSTGQPYYLPGWWSCNCYAILLDVTKPAARNWWWGKHPPFFGSQLAGLWTDLGEPERHPDDMVHYLGTTAKVHNIYNLLWAKTVFEGFNQFRPNQRLFNLTRSGYAGIQRYGVATWSGDVGKSFNGLAVQLPMLLNMGMSGIAYHNSDIGGFCCGTTSPELYARWMQFGAFCPITRAHGTGQPTEPWGYGTQVENISRRFIELRYQLLPYTYTMAYENSLTGMPFARPLFFADPGDQLLFNESSSYLWGNGILVSPVVSSGQTNKSVYLPAGRWVDFWNDQVYQGGQSVVMPTPLETIPIFIKTGSIIPMQPIMRYSDERPLDTLMLAVYPSTIQPAHFTLYEDDGKTLAYQSGGFALTEFSEELSGTSMTITLQPTQGTYTGRPLRRVYLSEVHGIDVAPNTVRKNGMVIPQRSSYGELRQNGDGFFYDAASNRLYIHVPTVPESLYQLTAEDIILDVDEPKDSPQDFVLEQNYPNPFNNNTRIVFTLHKSSTVLLKVHDVLGREVATPINGFVSAGKHEVGFDASGLASGVYIYRLSAAGYTQTRKLVLIK